MKNSKRIYVTKTFLPPIEEYQKYLNMIWDSSCLTNQGSLLRKLESELKSYLGVKYLHFVTNGTISLQLALNASDITDGEIITTPFSYVATVSSILWERCVPVFVDIDPRTWCIDAGKIESAITNKTKAIVAVHVFGHACDIKKIEAITKKHKLKVIYDGAHAFGVKYRNKSLLSYGDISVCSFHATKVFHTIEGGCVIARDKNVDEKLDLIKRFGHIGDDHKCLGINAKASEFQAAMGLCNLPRVNSIINARKKITGDYNKSLKNIALKSPPINNFEYNYGYYPIILKDEAELLEVVAALNENKIFPRRYFYPSLNTLEYIEKRQKCSVSEDISKRVLCLPLYVGLKKNTIEKICDIIKNIVNRKSNKSLMLDKKTF